VDLDGGVDVAGVYLIIVGHLAVAAAVLCSRVVTPAIVTLVVLPESTSSEFSLQKVIQNKNYHFGLLLLF
jgi:hypothetical protein